MGKLYTTALAISVAIAASPALAAQTDLTGWTVENSSPGAGVWTVQPGNDAVLQTINGNPTVFYSDFSAMNRALSGTIRVNDRGDDDFMGFVVGFNAGDLTGGATDFLLIDWKRGNQGSFGCTADAGLAVSHISAGLGNNAGAWCHQGSGVTELARGATLGNTGWVAGVDYTFDIAFTATNLAVSVNGVQQFNMAGNFSDGSFGFYNYSQPNVLYSNIEDVEVPPVGGAVPEPATWAMMLLGFGLLGGVMRRRGDTLTGGARALTA